MNFKFSNFHLNHEKDKYNKFMSLSSKFLQIKNSIKYKTLHPYKFYIFQHRYKFLREITIKKLLQEKEYIELNRKKTAKIFEPYFKELESENKLIIKYKAQFFNKQVDKFIGIIFTENYKNKLEILYE